MDMFKCNFAVESLTDKIIALINEEFPVLDSKVHPSVVHVDPDMIHPSLTVKVLASFLPDRLLRHLEQACRRRNASLPINQLPEDVLVEIFREHMESDFDRSAEDRGINYPRRRTTLAAVCTTWRAVINHTPALWTACTSDSPERVLRETFQRSGNSLLRVFAKMRGEGPSFWRIIAPYFNRCCRIEAPVSVSLRELIKSGALSLEILDVDGPLYPFDDPKLPHLFLEDGTSSCPRIKVVRLFDLAFPGGSSPFSDLRILDLRSLRELHLSTLLEMLERSPLLTELRLASFAMSEVPERGEEHRQIPLAKLEVLHIVGLHVRHVEFLLRVLQPPTLQELKIAPSGRAPLFHENLPSYIVASVTHILRDSAPFVIDQYNDADVRTIRAIGSRVCHFGHLELASLQWWLERIHTSCSSAPSEVLLGVFSQETITAADSYQTIKKVMLSGGDLYDFFLLICRPMEGGVWMLPKLSSITLSEPVGPAPKHSDMIQIVDLLYHRFALSSDVSVLSSVNYENDEADPRTEDFLRKMLYRLPGCKIHFQTITRPHWLLGVRW